MALGSTRVTARAASWRAMTRPGVRSVQTTRTVSSPATGPATPPIPARSTVQAGPAPGARPAAPADPGPVEGGGERGGVAGRGAEHDQVAAGDDGQQRPAEHGADALVVGAGASG